MSEIVLYRLVCVFPVVLIGVGFGVLCIDRALYESGNSRPAFFAMGCVVAISAAACIALALGY